MAFRIRPSYLIAAAITAGIAGWMLTGEIEVGGQKTGDEGAPPIAEREAERSAEKFLVSYVPLQPQQREKSLLVRGRTQADATVPIRSETGGVLEKRHFDKGQRVEAGDLVCEIDTAWRAAKVKQAEAALAQAQWDFDANRELEEKGFSSRGKMRQVEAALEAARAALEEAKTELDRTRVRANASGVVQDPIAEPGDILKNGDVCLTLIDTDPMLFIGQVSEREIANIEKGMEAQVELISGTRRTGTVSYIAPSADPNTRTFRVEIEMDNADRSIRDGLTASATIQLEPTRAFRVSPAWISLADDGRIGLKTLEDDNAVGFVPVQIVAQKADGFWVTGPEAGMRVITAGHEYVQTGEQVRAVADPVVNAALDASQNATDGERLQ